MAKLVHLVAVYIAIIGHMTYEQSEYPNETFTEFPSWEQPTCPRKNSFIDLMPAEHCFSDFPPCPDEAICTSRPEDGDLFIRFLTPCTPSLCEMSSADSLELPKAKKRTIKRLQIPARPPIPPVIYTVRQVGPISAEERKRKIARFLEKRNKRTWGKRIFYDCRKRVADHRLRVKGRFVAKQQAEELPEHDSTL